MKLFPNLPHELPPPEYPVVTLGVFDGVHLGHQKILATALETAAGRPTALVTFDPHPRAVLGPHKHGRLLTPIEERLTLLERWPLAAVGVLRFDQQVARLSYVDFVRRVLLDGLGARHLVLGYNVGLGKDRAGDRERLQTLGRELGFEVTIVPAVLLDGEPVSSTRIRHALDGGDVALANRLLGRPYEVVGTVVRGSGRGRALGFPTANLELPPDKLVPARGVYAVRVHLEHRQALGALNVGVVPTFRTDGGCSVEVHLLDHTGDLYGARIRLELLHRLRDEARFPGPEALQRQLRQDVESVRRLLASDPDGSPDP